MKKRSLGVLRCCAVSAILFSLLWGIFQPVSAEPAGMPDHQSSIIVLDYGPNDGVSTTGMLVLYNLTPATTGKCSDPAVNLMMQAPEVESLHLEIDFYEMSMSGTIKVSGVYSGHPESMSPSEQYHAEGTAEISFWDVSVKRADSDTFDDVKYDHLVFEGGSGEAKIAIEGSYFFIDIRSGCPDRSDSGSASGTVPVQSVTGIISADDVLYLDLVADTTSKDSVGADLSIYKADIPQIDLSSAQGEQPQQEAAPNPSQEEQPQLEEAPVLSDSESARFSISSGCDASIAAGQDIDCRVTIQRDNDDVGLLTVVWIMDGYVANQELVLGDSSTFTFPNPPPGSHTVQVQVVDTDTADVLGLAMDVEVGGFASPAEMPNRIPAGAQTASAVGTTALIGAWLWAEWLAAKGSALADERRDAAEARDRQAWYEDQMARNDEVKARQKARQQAAEAHQQALEAEWKRYRNDLLETVKKHEKSEYLVDLLDDLQEVVYSDGKWDADGLQRLEGMINSRLVLDREDEVRAEWKRMWDANKRREAEINGILRSHKMAAVEVTADLLTQGASNLIFMPTKALISAIYARRRAMMLDKTGWRAPWAVIRDAGLSLGLDYLSGKGHRQNSPSMIGKAAEKYLEKRLNVFSERTIADLRDDPEMPVHLWQGTGAKLVEVPKPATNLPVVKSSWGDGIQTNLVSPVYRPPGNNALMRVGMENGLGRISQLDSGLADDVRRMIGEGAQVDPHINNVLSPGKPSYSLTPQDEIARNLMNNPSYKQAVQDGLVPNRVQQAVNQTRDKIARNATAEAFRALDNIDLNGQPAGSYLQSVTVSGTGARPLNPQAVGRYTDWDAIVIARDGDVVGAAGRQAEELFKSHFDDALRQAGVNADTAEVSMFSGVHTSPDAPISEGYSSEGLTHWHKVDMTSQGQSAVRLEDGGVMFNAHPDAAPMQEMLMKDLGQMEAAPRFSAVSEDVAADARQLIHCHVDARVNETGGPLDPLTVLRLEGKHAARVWKVTNAGSGADMPDWMEKVMQLKNDPNYHLSGGELDQVWKNYTEYLDLPSDLGGGK